MIQQSTLDLKVQCDCATHASWQRLTVLVSDDVPLDLHPVPPHLLGYMLPMAIVHSLHDLHHVLLVHYFPFANLQTETTTAMTSSSAEVAPVGCLQCMLDTASCKWTPGNT